MWHVSSRSGVETLRTAIHLLHANKTTQNCAILRSQHRDDATDLPDDMET